MSTTLTRRVPTAQEHRELAESVGWGAAFPWESMAASLGGSICGVVAHDADELIGMGRVVGDGAFYFYVQDVAVRPERQHRGLGRAIMADLIAQIRDAAPGRCFVGLFATREAEPLYRSLGLTPGDLLGMFTVMPD